MGSSLHDASESGQQRAPHNALFPPTRATLLHRAASPDEEVARPAIDELFTIYRKPLLGLATHLSDCKEDAEDITNGFFLRFYERKDFQKADLSKGKLRTFLSVSLRNYRSSYYRTKNRRSPTESIDAEKADGRSRQIAANTLTPAEMFDRQWACALLQRVRDRLAAEFEEKNQSDLFEALYPLIPQYSRAEPIAEIAKRFGITNGALRVRLHRLRQRFENIRHEELANTVPEDEIEEELAYLRGLFG